MRISKSYQMDTGGNVTVECFNIEDAGSLRMIGVTLECICGMDYNYTDEEFAETDNDGDLWCVHPDDGIESLKPYVHADIVETIYNKWCELNELSPHQQ